MQFEKRVLLSAAICVCALTSSVGATSEQEVCARVAPDSTPYYSNGDKCAISCYRKFVDTFEAHVNAGKPCQGGAGFCALGKCHRGRFRAPLGELASYTIRIKRARVERADEITGTESDPFVVVSLVEGSSLTHAPGARLCATKTLWQQAQPEWEHSCRQVELESNAVLKFSVRDMDTIRSEQLGEVSGKLSALADRGELMLPLARGYHGSRRQTLTLSVSSKPYHLSRLYAGQDEEGPREYDERAPEDSPPVPWSGQPSGQWSRQPSGPSGPSGDESSDGQDED